jgi:hypothetical protein
MDSKIATLCDE